MSEKYDYGEYCLKADKEDFFEFFVIFLIDTWRACKRDKPDIPAPKKVNDELEALSKAISGLSDYTRRELIIRECNSCPAWSTEWIPEHAEKITALKAQPVSGNKTNAEILDLLEGNLPFPRGYEVLNGKSSLERLESLVVAPYVRESSDKGKEGRADGLAMKTIGSLVFLLWDEAGGIRWDEKTGRPRPKNKKKLIEFLQWLSEEVEAPDVDGFDAVTLYNNIFHKRIP